ncbi:MAG: hypothetical protein DRI28_05915 [Caldiserica bacterium]|nr:MAG: hypothetical protein DRI28_05915 [Caldisericota bacterium]
MDKLIIRDLTMKDEYFVGTCSHIYESEDYDRCAEKRIEFISKNCKKGLRVKVAIVDGEYVGFIHIIPIEFSPFGPIGENLMSIPCLFVQPNFRKKGVGTKLIKEAFKEAIKQDRNGIVTVGYSENLWFMPAEFFKKVGFKTLKVEKMKSLGEKYPNYERILLWKTYNEDAEKPDFLKPNYEFKSIPGKVVVDVFYNTFCQISLIQLEKVKRVIDEFSSHILLNLYNSDDREILLRYQIPQGVFINGIELGTLYGVSEYEIRKTIVKELKRFRE